MTTNTDRESAFELTQTEVLYVIATSMEPLTSNDVGHILGVDSKHASERLLALYRKGMLVRQLRPNNQPGSDPYEYALAIREVTFE